MMTSPESHARHVLSVYAKEAGAQVEARLLEKLIADEVATAVNESRDELREKMPCDRRNPCAFHNVCAHHKALAAAMMATQLAHR